MSDVGSEPVEVYRGGGGPFKADLLKATLDQEGIECIVSSPTAIAEHPLTVGPMGEFRLLVRAGDRERAEEVIKGLLSPVQQSSALGDGDVPEREEPSRRGVFTRARDPASKRARVVMLILGAALAAGSIVSVLAGNALWILLLLPGALFMAFGLGRR